MAKLLAARVAWSSADSALQIHGGNGYALGIQLAVCYVIQEFLIFLKGPLKFKHR